MYCIIAAEIAAGRFGLAIASPAIAGGFAHVHVAPKVGVVVRANGPRDVNSASMQLSLMALGMSPTSVLAYEMREAKSDMSTLVATANASGQADVRIEAGADQWSGFRKGANCIAFGTGLAEASVVEAMASSFEALPNEGFDARLLSALEAGCAAGGLAGSCAAHSAALMVYGAGVHSEVDLRVDLHDEAVGQLRALFDFHKPYEAFYRLRSENPRETPPQQAFMATIAQPGKEVV